MYGFGSLEAIALILLFFDCALVYSVTNSDQKLPNYPLDLAKALIFSIIKTESIVSKRKSSTPLAKK